MNVTGSPSVFFTSLGGFTLSLSSAHNPLVWGISYLAPLCSSVSVSHGAGWIIFPSCSILCRETAMTSSELQSHLPLSVDRNGLNTACSAFACIPSSCFPDVLGCHPQSSLAFRTCAAVTWGEGSLLPHLVSSPQWSVSGPASPSGKHSLTLQTSGSRQL